MAMLSKGGVAAVMLSKGGVAAVMLSKGGVAAAAMDADREAIRNAKIVQLVFREQLAEPGTAAVARTASSAVRSRDASAKKTVAAKAKGLEEFTAGRQAAPVFVWGKKPHCQRPRVRELYSFPTARPCRSRRPAHFLPMLQGGLLVVPPAAVSGFHQIDCKNRVLADLYTQISDMLEEEQRAALIAKITNRIHTTSSKMIKDVRVLRTEGFQIRRSIISFGAIPLAEPVAYWRWKCSLVPF